MSRKKRRASARIETERRRLQKANAIMICAMWAARHDVEADYDDVFDAVIDMVDHAVDALDSVELYRDDGDDA